MRLAMNAVTGSCLSLGGGPLDGGPRTCGLRSAAALRLPAPTQEYLRYPCWVNSKHRRRRFETRLAPPEIGYSRPPTISRRRWGGSRGGPRRVGVFGLLV